MQVFGVALVSQQLEVEQSFVHSQLSVQVFVQSCGSQNPGCVWQQGTPVAPATLCSCALLNTRRASFFKLSFFIVVSIVC